MAHAPEEAKEEERRAKVTLAMAPLTDLEAMARPSTSSVDLHGQPQETERGNAATNVRIGNGPTTKGRKSAGKNSSRTSGAVAEEETLTKSECGEREGGSTLQRRIDKAMQLRIRHSCAAVFANNGDVTQAARVASFAKTAAPPFKDRRRRARMRPLFFPK